MTEEDQAKEVEHVLAGDQRCRCRAWITRQDEVLSMIRLCQACYNKVREFDYWGRESSLTSHFRPT